MINLETILRIGLRKVVKMNFTVANFQTSYNVILVDNLVGVIRADRCVARKCYDDSTHVLEDKQGKNIVPEVQT
ncbi:hypothetical protein CR513_06802, partial [Mucuna pruriens]